MSGLRYEGPIEPEEMAALDEDCEHLGLARSLLMENAGSAIIGALKRKVGSLGDKEIVIVSGTGNNGGDGFVAARHATAEAGRVIVVLIGNPEDIRTEEAKANWKILERMPFSVKLYTVTDPSALDEVKRLIQGADIIIDAIFGTGVRGRIREPYSSIIDLMNSSKGMRVSVDTPSGLDPYTGEAHDKVVRADMTVTLHRIKSGLREGGRDIGELVVAPIGIAPDFEVLIGPGDVRMVLKPRLPHSKKGDFGRLLVVGGSADYAGAPALAALAALRTGTDVVIVAAPRSVSDAIRGFSPNLIVRELSGEHLVRADLPLLEKLVVQSTSVVVGPGLGLEEEAREAALVFMRGTARPLLVDADALKALSADPYLLRGRRAILTPHAGEFQILTGEKMSEPQELRERMRQVSGAAKRLGTTMLVKAHEDIVADGRRLKINITGNPGMTVGGTGDVLSGIAATFLGWGAEPFRAACAAAFVSGRAGDLAKTERGYHIVATDVIEKIPDAIRGLEPE
jgi:NAD(P)H-hydrate epimerase